MNVLVVGGSGFVGGAVCDAVRGRGHELCIEPAPRLPPHSLEQSTTVAAATEPTPQLDEALQWADVVINCAGKADATGSDEGQLVAANTTMPFVLAVAAQRRGVSRFVHLSSAAVQGQRGCLDATSEVAPFSPYSRSKARAESALLGMNWPAMVIFRPQGVHGADRAVTRTLARLARSPMSSVASPGDWPTAQDLVENVADAAAFIATSPTSPPVLVSHPRGELTAADLMQALGGRPPRLIPTRLARIALSSAYAASHIHSSFAAQARRLETMWFGQKVADSWLISAGWVRPRGPEGWNDLAGSL